MAAKRAEVAEAVLALIDSGKSRQQIARSVAAYLADNRRSKELNSLLRDIEELRFKNTGSLEATATTARPLSAEAKQKIRDLFKAKQVNIHEQIDPTLVGGVRVRALDKVADFSVQARLWRLRKGL